MTWPGDTRTRAERHAENTCNLCAIWLHEESDEAILAIEDWREFLHVLRTYRNREEGDILFEEWKRRDRERHRLT